MKISETSSVSKVISSATFCFSSSTNESSSDCVSFVGKSSNDDRKSNSPLCGSESSTDISVILSLSLSSKKVSRLSRKSPSGFTTFCSDCSMASSRLRDRSFSLATDDIKSSSPKISSSKSSDNNSS